VWGGGWAGYFLFLNVSEHDLYTFQYIYFNILLFITLSTLSKPLLFYLGLVFFGGGGTGV
jgi:hypothetical protein